VSLPEALEAAAGALAAHADAIRPANGDPARLLASLDSAGAAQVLAWLLAERPADAEELAEAWCEAEAGVPVLLAIDEAALPKEGKKRLRRIRHRLRSRGVATPEPPPAPTVARLPELGDELSGAYVTAFDPMGARQVWWLEPHPSGGARLFEAALDDARGVVAFEVYSATRSDVRRFLRRLAENEAFPAFAVEPDTAKALVLRASERQAGEGPAPKRWVEWRGRLAAAAGARLPGDLAAEALAGGPGDASADLDAAARLVAEGRVGPWPPLRETMLPVVERFRTALDSPIVVSGAAKREQVARLLDEAASEVFAADAGAVAAHRFRESAFAFWRRGDEAAARACLAAAAAFTSRPPAENPVARAFLELWLRPLLGAAAGEAPGAPAQEAEPSLLVRP
jgi:hypothetical protein